MAISQERKFWIALGLFAILIVVAWQTLGTQAVSLFGGLVQVRLIVAVVIGTFAFRTAMAHWASKIRKEDEES